MERGPTVLLNSNFIDASFSTSESIECTETVVNFIK